MTVRRDPSGRPADTLDHVWWRQMDAIRARTVPQRLEEWRRLNEAGAAMEERSVRMRHPDYDDSGVFLDLVVARYGPELWPSGWESSPDRSHCGAIAAVNDLDISYMQRWAAELGVQDDLTELLGEQV